MKWNKKFVIWAITSIVAVFCIGRFFPYQTSSGSPMAPIMEPFGAIVCVVSLVVVAVLLAMGIRLLKSLEKSW